MLGFTLARRDLSKYVYKHSYLQAIRFIFIQGRRLNSNTMRPAVLLGVICFGLLCSTAVDGALPTGSEITRLAIGNFQGLDLDKNGVMSQMEWHRFETAVDIDGDGCLTLQEFVTATGSPLDMATAIFNIVDKSHTNCITTTQLEREFEFMDNDADGQVTQDEFKAFFLKLFTQIEIMATVG